MATVVTGVIGSDIHCVGIKLIEYSLEKAGFDVVSLGNLCSQEDFVNAAIETAADAVFVSSSYGHAEIDCEGFGDNLSRAHLSDTIVYLGGNVGSSGRSWEETERTFLGMGFTRVFPPRTAPDQAIAQLRQDLAERSARR